MPERWPGPGFRGWSRPVGATPDPVKQAVSKGDRCPALSQAAGIAAAGWWCAVVCGGGPSDDQGLIEAGGTSACSAGSYRSDLQGVWKIAAGERGPRRPTRSGLAGDLTAAALQAPSSTHKRPDRGAAEGMRADRRPGQTTGSRSSRQADPRVYRRACRPRAATDSAGRVTLTRSRSGPRRPGRPPARRAMMVSPGWPPWVGSAAVGDARSGTAKLRQND
jgi:hypothetical protein